MSVRSFKYIGIILATLLALVAVLLIVAINGPGERFIKSWIEDTITSTTGLSTSIGTFETNAFTRVQIDQCLITPPEPSSCDTLVYLSRLRVDYSLWNLIWGDLDFDNILLDTVIVCMVRDTAGQFGIPVVDTAPATPPDTAAFDLGLTIGNLTLNALRVRYNDELYSLGIGTVSGKLDAEHLSGSDYRFSVAMDSCRLVYDTLPIILQQFIASGVWTGESISLDSLLLGLEELRVSARADISGPEYGDISAEVTVNGPLHSIADRLRSYTDIPVQAHEGEMNAWIRFEGSTDAPIIDLQLDLPPLTVNTARIDRATLIARYSGDDAIIDTLDLALFGGHLAASGSTVLDSTLASEYNLQFDNLQLKKIWEIIYSEPALYTGQLAGTLNFSGAGTDPSGWKIDSRIDARKLTYQSKAIPDLKLSLAADNGTARLTVDEGNNRINATLRIDSQNLQGDFDINIPNLSPLAGWLDQPELHGSFTAAGTIGGEIDNPTVAASLTGHDIRYRNFPVDTVFGRVGYANSAITVDTLTLHGDWRYEEDRPNPFDLDSLGGQFTYAVDLAGTLQHMRGLLRADLAQPQFGAYSLDSAGILARLDGSRVELADLDIHLAHLRLSADATFDTLTREGNLEAHLFAQHRDSLGLDSLTWHSAGDLASDFALTLDSQLIADAAVSDLHIGPIIRLLDDTLDASALLDLEIAFKGTLLRPTAEFLLSARDIAYSGTAVDSITAHCELEDDQVDLTDFRLYAFDHQALLNAGLGLARDSDGMLMLSDSSSIRGALDIDSLDLTLARPFMPPGSELTGRSTIHVSWSGTMTAPAIVGTVDIHDADYILDPASRPVESINLSVMFQDSLVFLTEAVATVENIPVTAGGTAMYQRPDRLKVDLSAALDQSATISAKGFLTSEDMDLQITMDRFDLQVVRPFVTYVDTLDGTLQCLLKITGPPAAPQIDGYLTLADVMVDSPEFFTRLVDGFGAIRFDRQRAVIDSLHATVNGGRASLEGHLAYDSTTVTEIDLTLSADSIPYSDPDNFDARINMVRLNYKKQDPTNLISGDVHLGETWLTRRFPMRSILPWVQEIETVDLEFPEMLEQAQLNVRIRESDNLWVDNNLARIRMHAELGVIGSPVQPNFTGMIEIKEGYLLYLDRKFKVTAGTVYFIDPVRFNPDILLTAGTQVTTYQNLTPTRYNIVFDARGPLDDLKLGLTSDPPLDKPDIVALLTLGSTRSQLTGTDGEGSGAKNALVNRATMISSRKVSGYVSDKVGSFFGFDEFTVEGNLFQFDRSWGPQLLASRKISDRLELSYTTTVGRLNDQTVRLEYRFTPRFSLQGQTDRVGRSLIDFKYGFRFR